MCCLEHLKISSELLRNCTEVLKCITTTPTFSSKLVVSEQCAVLLGVKRKVKFCLPHAFFLGGGGMCNSRKGSCWIRNLLIPPYGTLGIRVIYNLICHSSQWTTVMSCIFHSQLWILDFLDIPAVDLATMHFQVPHFCCYEPQCLLCAAMLFHKLRKGI